MRRTVTIEIDQKAFSEAYRGMTGNEAKELLVMLAFGGHSVSAHSACLRDVGIRPAPEPSDPAALQARTDGRIARAAEEFLSEVSGMLPSEVLDGLADRPRPGCKKRAREAFTRLLKSIHGLRTAAETARPLALVPSEKSSPRPSGC